MLQKIEGIDKPALGTTTFDFMFTHSVSNSMGILPCWYSATFSAVGRASATVNLNPGAAWWKPSTGHYVLRVLSKPSGPTPARSAVTMALPLPQLPQSVHDVSIDNTLSKPVSSDHSWTYPGLACGVIIKPQFSQSVLYAQAQSEAFTQATTVPERDRAADRRGGEGGHHDHRRQLHHADPERAQLQGQPVHHPLGPAGRRERGERVTAGASGAGIQAPGAPSPGLPRCEATGARKVTCVYMGSVTPWPGPAATDGATR